MALSLFAFLLGAQAFAECKWTVQSTIKAFTEDEIFKEKPQIQKAACSADGTPACVGYVYCEVAGRQLIDTSSVACKAIKVAGKWKCPDAQTCSDDPDVMISNLPHYPDKFPAAAPAPAPADEPGAVRETPGGR